MAQHNRVLRVIVVWSGPEQADSNGSHAWTDNKSFEQQSLCMFLVDAERVGITACLPWIEPAYIQAQSARHEPRPIRLPLMATCSRLEQRCDPRCACSRNVHRCVVHGRTDDMSVWLFFVVVFFLSYVHRCSVCFGGVFCVSRSRTTPWAGQDGWMDG